MNRAKEIAAGFVLMLVASATAVQFFLTHNRYENPASIPYLLALGIAELFLVGLSWRLIFLPLTQLPTTPRGRSGVSGTEPRRESAAFSVEPFDYLEEIV